MSGATKGRERCNIRGDAVNLKELTNEEGDCDCLVDPEDGSTITACILHPQGGSPKSHAIWAARLSAQRREQQ